MELHVVVLILVLTQSASEDHRKQQFYHESELPVYWYVSNKPVIYGDNIILTCKTGHVLTDKGGACRVRQWYSGKNLLLYNDVPIDATKYGNTTSLSSTEFSLVIKNYSESDLNINYACSCGFKSYTKRLDLNDNNFIVPPLRVEKHIQQSNETLSIYVHVERVYPCPECYIVIEDRTDNLTLTSVKRGLFHNATYEANFNIVADDCGKKPTLLCFIGNEYNIVNTSGEPIRNCTEVRDDGVNTSGYTNTSTEAYTTNFIEVQLGVVSTVVVLVGLLTVGVIIYKRRRTCISRSIQKRKGILITKTDDSIASDGDLSIKILPMKSEILNPTASGVDLNDETCSLQSDKNVSIEDIL